MAKRNTVTTWADGFGNWHARIEFPHTMSESDSRPEFNLDYHWDAIRSTARRAIRREILARENGPIRPVRVEVEKQGVYSDNTWYSVTFKELA